MAQRVFVVGVGMTKFEKPGRRLNDDGSAWDYPDMARESGTKALADAGISYDEIEEAYVGYVYGESTSGQRAVYELGLTGIPVVWGAVSQYGGQAGLSWAAKGPTYRDLFPVPPAPGTVPSCEVGGVLPTPERAADLAPRAVFEGGVQLLSVNVLLTALPHTYQLTFDWIMEAPLDATVFVHVRESAGNVVAQADGAMASGLLPFWAVHPGDRVRDVRYITLPENAAGPFSVFVGLYRDAERFPAYVDGARVPDDAVLVGHWGSFE